MGSADPPGEIDEKLKSKNMKKGAVSIYFESNHGRQV